MTARQKDTTAVLVFGPPLPGRTALARALERQLPHGRWLRCRRDIIPEDAVRRLVAEGSTPVIECALATAAARERAAAAVAKAGAHCLFVAWTCDRDALEREIYHRYASIPRRYADHWAALFELDQDLREPPGDELGEAAVVCCGSHGATANHVVRVATALGLSGPSPHQVPARRVLVVDDEEDSRTMIAETLEALGCHVFTAGDAEQALDIAEGEPLDLVITDQAMPGASGVELAEELARRRPEVRVAILTGFAEQTVEDALRARGVALLLAKPARAADLIRLLEEIALDPPESPELAA